jgi:hypothetical protein
MSGIQRFLVSRQVSYIGVRSGKVLGSGGSSLVEQVGYRIHYFTTPGDYTMTFSLPGLFEIFMWGAGGGGGTAGGWSYGAPGGGGGFSSGIVNSNGSSYFIKVGGGGTANGLGYSIGNGGAAKSDSSDNRYAGQGGGLSGLFSTAYNTSNAIIIAGGGGGGAGSRAGTGNQGGAGGGLTAQDGVAPYDSQSALRGRGGGQTGPTTLPTNGNAIIPTQFGGGTTVNYGGGGGGGWWGGSAGTYAEGNTMAGGGGGSGYFNSSMITNGVLTTGNLQTAANTANQYWSNYGTGGNVASTGANGAVIIRYLL